jgi:hypothetical protein
MKKLIIILLLATISCTQKEECKFPPPPYGQPNDVSQYVGNNYSSITYRYNCLNGRYTSVTYSTSNGCKWNASYFYSTCIK